MSVWAWATWIAIVVLVAGSLAVFAWFCLDLVRLNRATRDEAGEPVRRQPPA